ncbi:MAG: hypothetical protein QOG56_2144 [Solirubrobacteraceae bacterium]|nr:hypothetical protein [Solirubrobacteraceae bacterium]
MVLVFVSRRTLDAEVALDITAETFAQAFRGRRGFRGSTEPEERAWLLTIARRQIGRYLRRGVVERRALERLGATVPVVHEDDLSAIEDAAQLAELRAALGSELDRLRSDQREALRLRVIEERPYAERAVRRDPALCAGDRDHPPRRPAHAPVDDASRSHGCLGLDAARGQRSRPDRRGSASAPARGSRRRVTDPGRRRQHTALGSRRLAGGARRPRRPAQPARERRRSAPRSGADA